MATGSGRSISGVDLGAAIIEAREQGLIERGGGHAMAAGLTIAASKIGALREFLNNALEDKVAHARANQVQEIDALVAPSAVTGEFAGLIAAAGPFGPGNPEPVFALANLRMVTAKIVGKGHLAATLEAPDGAQCRTIAFRAEGEAIEEIMRSGNRFHVCGKIRKDDWRGPRAAQLHITDAAPASA